MDKANNNFSIPSSRLYIFDNVPMLAQLDRIFSDLKLNNKEIYHKNYFERRLTLSQNMDFHFNFMNKDLSIFLKDLKYEDFFNQNKDVFVKDLNFFEEKQISLLAYLHLNKNFILYDINLIQILRSYDKEKKDIVKGFLTNNRVYSFTKFMNVNSIMNLEKYFNQFIISMNNSTIIKKYDNADEFKENLESLKKFSA